jgi:TRAP-type C4-dicarboxylate transport system permease small subunit
MRRLHNVCENRLAHLASGAIFLMMVLTTIDAGGRYLFNLPIIWAYDITTFFLAVGGVFLATTLTYRGGAFIRVTFFLDRLSMKKKLLINYIAQVFSVFYSVTLTIAMFLQTLRIVANKTTLSTIDFPLWPAYMIALLGLFFLSLRMILDLGKVKTGESGLFQQEPEESK